MLWTKLEEGNREQQPLKATESYRNRARPGADTEERFRHCTKLVREWAFRCEFGVVPSPSRLGTGRTRVEDS